MSVDLVEQLPANVSPPFAEFDVGPSPFWLDGDPIRSGWLATVNQLEEAWREAQHDDWGGEGEIATSRDAVELARRLLVELRDRFPPPGVGPDPQGGIAIEWFFERSRSVGVTISNEGVLYYAVLEGNRRESGAGPLGHSIPAPLFAALSRLQGESFRTTR